MKILHIILYKCHKLFFSMLLVPLACKIILSSSLTLIFLCYQTWSISSCDMSYGSSSLYLENMIQLYVDLQTHNDLIFHSYSIGCASCSFFESFVELSLMYLLFFLKDSGLPSCLVFCELESTYFLNLSGFFLYLCLSKQLFFLNVRAYNGWVETCLGSPFYASQNNLSGFSFFFQMCLIAKQSFYLFVAPLWIQMCLIAKQSFYLFVTPLWILTINNWKCVWKKCVWKTITTCHLYLIGNERKVPKSVYATHSRIRLWYQICLSKGFLPLQEMRERRIKRWIEKEQNDKLHSLIINWSYKVIIMLVITF